MYLTRPSLSAVNAGVFAAFIGFSSTFAIVLSGLKGVGANNDQAISGLVALCMIMGLCGIALSLYYRQPISIVWSTPGLAMMTTMGWSHERFGEAIFAFSMCGLMLILIGLIRSFGELIAKIPLFLAQAILAGILLPLCLMPMKALEQMPSTTAPVILIWFALLQWRRLWAVPVAVVATLVEMSLLAPSQWLNSALALPHLQWTLPEPSLQSFVSLAIPLLVITMASQNIPGYAVLEANQYHPPINSIITFTGVISAISAVFAAPTINLAAITAALCAGKDVHPDKNQRYWAAVAAGITYIIFGLAGAVLVAFMSISPILMIEAVAGLALLPAFLNALAGCLQNTRNQEVAILTFVITASGISFVGIGSAFWGLCFGLIASILIHLRKPFK